MYRTVVLV